MTSPFQCYHHNASLTVYNTIDNTSLILLRQACTVKTLKCYVEDEGKKAHERRMNLIFCTLTTKFYIFF